MNNQRWIRILALLVLVAGAAPGRAVAQTKAAPSPKLRLSPCRLPGWNEDVRCGQYEVFEDRRAKTGRTISLRIVVVPARAPKAAPDPIFYFMGGPGGSAVDTITRAGSEFLASLRRDRDLVFVDQRGTGGSNPLVCDLYGDKSDMTAYFGTLFPTERLTACRDALGKVANLELYTTTIAMEDLDEVRSALGYDTINLLGGSYGSTAAMAYLRQFPKHVRTATLLGVAPPDMKLPLPFARGVQNALDKLFADCAADARCHEGFPDPKADLLGALERFENGPLTVQTFNPIAKRMQTVRLTRQMFVDLVRVMLYTPEYSKTLPLLLRQSSRGDFVAFVSMGYLYFRGFDDLIARGMHFCVVCAEDLPFITDADIAREMTGTLYGDDRMKAYQRLCALWPRGAAPKDFATPVKSDVPVLLVSGEADPVTPPWLAEQAAKHFPNGRHVSVPHTGHFFDFDCVDALVATFVAKGSAKDLDVSCLARIGRPAFVTEAMVEAVRRSQSGESRAPVAGEEVWEGVLDVGAAKLRLALRIAKAEDGSLTAVLDSLDQNARGLPVDTITRKDSTLRFEMAAIGAVYEGTIDAGGSTVTGTWKQGGRTWPLEFKRGSSQ
jgi:pimeloyl-ACP methyl ester carboxylesterase